MQMREDIMGRRLQFCVVLANSQQLLASISESFLLFLMHCNINLVDVPSSCLCDQTGQNKTFCKQQLYRPSWSMNIRQINPKGRDIYCWMFQSFIALSTTKHFHAFVRLSSLCQMSTFVLFVNTLQHLAPRCVECRNLAACQPTVPDDHEVLWAPLCWLIEAADLRQLVLQWAQMEGASVSVKTVIMVEQCCRGDSLTSLKVQLEMGCNRKCVYMLY